MLKLVDLKAKQLKPNKMRKYLIAISICTVAIFTSSCRDKKPETTTIVKEVQVEKEVPVETKQEGILERTGQKVDDKVNQEIDKKIDKIGED